MKILSWLTAADRLPLASMVQLLYEPWLGCKSTENDRVKRPSFVLQHHPFPPPYDTSRREGNKLKLLNQLRQKLTHQLHHRLSELLPATSSCKTRTLWIKREQERFTTVCIQENSTPHQRSSTPGPRAQQRDRGRLWHRAVGANTWRKGFSRPKLISAATSHTTHSGNKHNVFRHPDPKSSVCLTPSARAQESRTLPQRQENRHVFSHTLTAS